MTDEATPMNRFSHIKIGGFRRLLDIDLELRPLSVLIGANGVGKTSFLDALALLAASAEGRLSKAIMNLGGIAALTTYDAGKELSFELAATMSDQDKLLEYELTIIPQGTAYTTKHESLHPPSSRDILRIALVRAVAQESLKEALGGDVACGHDRESPTWEYSALETGLSQAPKTYKEIEEFRRFLASSVYYHVLPVGERAPVRLPQQVHPTSLPGKDGEDLIACLYNLRETDRGQYEEIEQTVHLAFSGFERFDFPPVAAGMLTMTWKDRNYSRPFYANQFSEGMLRFLWLTALLHSPELPAITLLDEPEISLHPELLSILVGLMRDASLRTNLIVATQSDMLVRFLEPREVVVMDMREDGSASMTWADSLDLDKWLKDYTLDEVWRMGRMGGRA